jgi:DNA-directed RNA polymerase subunit RPC12/RpoP
MLIQQRVRAVRRKNMMKMPNFHSHTNEELQCPYKGCEKKFDRPTMLTDKSTLPSQSYYACPHCMSKIDMVTEKMKVIEVKATEYPATVFESPAKCAVFAGGLMGSKLANGDIPDECLVCPKVVQCDARRR